MNTVFAVLVGLLCGILSGFGIGGGSLLMIYMTAIAFVEQKTAQAINLLYFLPTAGASLLLHTKNRLIRWNIVLPAAVAGCFCGAAAAWVCAGMESSILRKIFGFFLLTVGMTEFAAKPKN